MNFVTHPMSTHMVDISDGLRKRLCQNKSAFNLGGINLEKKNHMTLLTYYLSSTSDRKLSMGFHSVLL